MWLPLLLIIPAILAAAVTAYGIHPAWAQYARGLDVIIFSRQALWPLTALSICLCIALIGVAASGRRRAWWIIGLAPVLALFVHRFVNDPARRLAIWDNPPLVDAAQVTFLSDADYVVGLEFGDQPYAFSFADLYSAPVVMLDDHDRRQMLMWSAFANRALAFRVSRDLRARDLEIVGQPGNALLLYNQRLGQFINGVTGQTMTGQTPTGFAEPTRTSKMRWSKWRALHPQTKVMQRRRDDGPRGPVRPRYPLPPPASVDPPADTLITFIGAAAPRAVRSQMVNGEPLNLDGHGAAILLAGAPARAFDRRVGERVLSFTRNSDPRMPMARWTDVETHAGWNENGVALYGPADMKGKKLASIPAEDELYWGVMKFWYPTLAFAEAAPATRPAALNGSLDSHRPNRAPAGAGLVEPKNARRGAGGGR